MTIDVVAAKEGEAISKANSVRTRTPKRTRASLKPVPKHMRADNSTELYRKPVVPEVQISSWLQELINSVERT